MAVDTFGMPFLNGQIAPPAPVTAASADPTPVAPPASLFTGQLMGGLTEPSKAIPVDKTVPYIAPQYAVQGAPVPTTQPSQTGTQTTATPYYGNTQAALPTLDALPTLSEYQSTGGESRLSKFLHGDLHLPGPRTQAPSWDPFNSTHTDQGGYNKALSNYFSTRDQRLGALLGQIDPTTAGQIQSSLDYQLGTISHGYFDSATGGPAQAGAKGAVPYAKLSPDMRASAKDSLYTNAESLAQQSTTPTASTNPRLTYTPAEQLALQALVQNYMAPVIAQAQQGGQAASGAYNELAQHSTSSPAFAALARTEGAQQNANASAMGLAYAQQAEALPAMFAMQQQQAYANQIAGLQSQLASSQQGSGSTALSSLLPSGG